MNRRLNVRRGEKKDQTINQRMKVRKDAWMNEWMYLISWWFCVNLTDVCSIILHCYVRHCKLEGSRILEQEKPSDQYKIIIFFYFISNILWYLYTKLVSWVLSNKLTVQRQDCLSVRLNPWYLIYREQISAAFKFFLDRVSISPFCD